MGWWGFGIMSGDTPMDIEAGLLETAGIPVFDYMGASNETYRSEVESNIDNMEKYIEGINWGINEYNNIGYQVLGVMVMSTGAKISSELVDRIIKGADDDEWAKEGDNERIKFIDDFKTAIRSYDTNGGTTVTIDREGLFEKIFNASGEQ